LSLSLADCGHGQGLGPYSTLIKKTEKDIKEMAKKVNDLCGKFLLPHEISAPTALLHLQFVDV
jgi:hypothetical protein